ncbi:MmgE/PrpD family protein [Polaromonas sp. UC242_47]|uniref:MmgE/PrpD family protein n=1 Tax=Polaromonas sp. UC242_47 TaxID=3374626 RepID=UPI003795FF7D
MTSPPADQGHNALATLARHAGTITAASIPAAVKRQACLCILDTIGCMLAGTRTEEAALMVACERALAGAEGATAHATIAGHAGQLPLLGALRVNGYLGDVLELNDLIGGHASIGNVSAALAVAEVEGSSGERLLEAVVRGIEVTTLVYNAVYPTLKRYTESALVPVGIPSSIGAAAAAAHLLDLDEAQSLHAMAIAGGLAGWCPAEVIFGQGGSMKPLLFGAQPGATGVTAALYARQGMTGPQALLDGPLGYFRTSARDARFQSHDTWALAQPRRKLHACCGYLHSAVDALGRLRARLGTAALAQGHIEVRVAPYVADVVSKPHQPLSPNDARFHLQFCLALVACGADVILPDHSIDLAAHLARPEVQAAMQCIRVAQDTAITHYHQCEVVHEDASGARTAQSIAAPRGSPQEPLGDDEVVGKFMALAASVMGAPAARAFANQTLALDTVADVRSWAAGMAAKT